MKNGFSTEWGSEWHMQESRLRLIASNLLFCDTQFGRGFLKDYALQPLSARPHLARIVLNSLPKKPIDLPRSIRLKTAEAEQRAHREEEYHKLREYLFEAEVNEIHRFLGCLAVAADKSLVGTYYKTFDFH